MSDLNDIPASPVDDSDDEALDNQVIELDRNLTDEETTQLAGRPLRFRVGSNLKFNRLDKYLCGRFSQFSRTRLQALIREQEIGRAHV